MSASATTSRKQLSRNNSKNPERFKYIAYLKFEINNTVLYYHFYNNDVAVEVKTPHIFHCNEVVVDAVVYKYVKPFVLLDTELNNNLEQKINSIIDKLSRKYNREFEVIDDQ